MWPFTKRHGGSAARGSKRVSVLGAELAAAREAEEVRLAKGDRQPGPIPQDARYNWDTDDSDPINLKRLPADDKLAEVCRRYAGSDPAVRAAMRASTSMDDFYALIGFARRSGHFALRDPQGNHIRDALTGIAMIEKDRVDYRDILMTLSLLQSVALRNNDNGNDLIREAATLAEPGTSKLMIAAANRSPQRDDPMHGTGFMIVETEVGPCLFSAYGSPYHPTYPLDRMALGVSALLRADKYQANVTLCSELPACWLSGVDDAALAKALKNVVAGTTVHGRLRADESPTHYYQQLMLFLVELGDESAAKSLEQLADAKAVCRDDVAMLAVRNGRLFGLLIAGCCWQGGKPFETQESLARFGPGIAQIVRAHC